MQNEAFRQAKPGAANLRIDLAAAELTERPFLHFFTPTALDKSFAGSLVDWVQTNSGAPWCKNPHYDAYELSPGKSLLSTLREPTLVENICEQMGRIFDLNLTTADYVCTLHRFLPGQHARVHCDGSSTGRKRCRMVVQLSDGRVREDGGVFQIYDGFPEGAPSEYFSLEEACWVMPLTCGAAFGFLLTDRSWHAITPVVNGERITLVYSFYEA